MTEMLEKIYFNNSLQDYLIAFGIIFAGIVIIRLFRRAILRRLKTWAEATDTKLDDMLVGGVERFGLPLLNVGVIYTGIKYLTLTGKITKIVDAALTVVIIFFVVRLVSSTIKIVLESYARRQEGGNDKVKQLRGIMVVIDILLWCLGVVFLFDNLGYNVTAVITGLGIGGIAIALAAQNILGDLFNYFVIFFDRPFEIGDFIVLDDKSGTVEHVGIKTTRIKSLSGEQIVVSNTDLTNSRLHNYKRMQERRILFTLGVIYQTTPERLRKIPQLIREAIEAQKELARFDRAHFSAYGDFSLNFEVVYFVLNPDFNIYRDVHQAINMKIFESFAKEGIEFAYPTQTLFVEKNQV
jgi:small-conductance mechanosensitive channel